MRDATNLILRHGGWVPGSANETLYFRGGPHNVEGLIVHCHLYKHVPRVALAGGRLLLSVAHLDHLLGGYQDLTKLVPDSCTLNCVLESKFSLVLVARMRVDDVPVHSIDPSDS